MSIDFSVDLTPGQITKLQAVYENGFSTKESHPDDPIKMTARNRRQIEISLIQRNVGRHSFDTISWKEMRLDQVVTLYCARERIP